MGKAARELLMRKFTVSAMADGVEEGYDRLPPERPRRD